MFDDIIVLLKLDNIFMLRLNIIFSIFLHESIESDNYIVRISSY